MKTLWIQCAGLDSAILACSPRLRNLLHFEPIYPVFPAVTSVCQGTIRTGLPPAEHGVVSNGRFDRITRKVEFWGQSAGVIRGRRVWSEAGERCAVLFFQQSLGERGVLTISPAPFHFHHGGMMSAVHCTDTELSVQLEKQLGRFPLHRYWGPMANISSSRWCAECTLMVLRERQPELVFTYFPHLDYILQKEGPNSLRLAAEAEKLAALLEKVLTFVRQFGYEVCVWGDYSIEKAEKPIFPNRILWQKGLFTCRYAGKRAYPNLYDSRAFAMCDHQVAHVYIRDSADISVVRECLQGVPGVESVRTAAEAGLACPESGDLILTAAPGAWFAYSWWKSLEEAPDYAEHIDIHSKIGYDPCELFWRIPFFRTATDPSLVRGTHGRPDRPAVYGVTEGLKNLRGISTLLELSRKIPTLLS